jgi:hypothetical protein
LRRGQISSDYTPKTARSVTIRWTEHSLPTRSNFIEIPRGIRFDQLLHWFLQSWSGKSSRHDEKANVSTLFLESEQSDFIRRLIVTLDERQQYFTSCVIAVNSFAFFSIFRSIVFVFTFSFQQRHYRDFISLLPTQISFAILNHLTLKELTIARRVR